MKKSYHHGFKRGRPCGITFLSELSGCWLHPKILAMASQLFLMAANLMKEQLT